MKEKIKKNFPAPFLILLFSLGACSSSMETQQSSNPSQQENTLQDSVLLQRSLRYSLEEKLAPKYKDSLLNNQ
jgi:hypothetical protein